MIRIGITGTQYGGTIAQLRMLERLLSEVTPRQPVQVHHGDCTGVDAQAHEIAMRLGHDIYIYPPVDQSRRAFCDGAAVTYAPDDYLRRNKAIVIAIDRLIAVPKEPEQELRSGTWATWRYARRLGKPTVIINPDGTLNKGDA